MKTAQIMSVDYAGITVQQNHKTRQINATEFLGRWNSSNATSINIEENQDVVIIRDLPVFKDLVEFKRLSGINRYLAKMSEIQGIPVDKLIVSKRGKNGGTWVNELVFIKMMRWLSPEFEAIGDKILQSKILEYRDQSGEAYKALCESMDKNGLIKDHWDYAKIGTAISYSVLNDSSKGCWNNATEEQLEKRKDIEVYLTQTINDGFITSIEQAVKLINKKV